ncbi:MAG: Hsp70 family protein [Bacteroidota bacterium]
MIIVGIDLGTTNSVLALLGEGVPETIAIDGNKLLPSVVTYTQDKFIVGQVAKNMALLEPENTIASVKRKMGQDVQLPIGGKKLRPEEVSALILKKIKKVAIDHLQVDENETIGAVITVPAYFTEVQRDATKQAAELAGLQVERIINEPTAAALSFGLSQMDEAMYAVYDFGGGTFDVSVIESDEGVIEVLASTGNNELGGDDLDDLLAEHIWRAFTAKNDLGNIDPSAKEQARLIRVAEQTKIKLSQEHEVEIQESFFYQQAGVSYHIDQSLSRSDFEGLIKEKVEETVYHLKKAINDADVTEDELDGIILVGGSSRIPMITSLIEERLGIIPTLIDLPDEAVAHGAAIQAAIIQGKNIDTVLIDITPHSLGIGVMDDISYASSMSQFFGLNKKESADDIEKNLGAAAIIPRNTAVPVRRSQKFSAVSRLQEAYQIQVYQGEKSRFSENKIIGEVLFELENPIEDGEIEVTFELDLNGLLKMSAEETTTKEQIKATFKSSRGKKIKKSVLDEAVLSNMDEAENTLLNRANALLEVETMNAEDKAELGDLVEAYKAKRMGGDEAGVKVVENQLLDLLYYLENDGN